MSSKLLHITHHHALPLKTWYIIGGLFFTLTTWLTLFIPLKIEAFIDLYLAQAPLSDLTRTTFVICLLGGIIIITRTISRICIFWGGRMIASTLRNEYFERSFRFTQAGREKFAIGDLITRMSLDMRIVGFFFGFGVVQIMNFSLVMTFSLYNMYVMSPALTGYVLLPLILNIIAMRLITPKLFELSKHQQHHVSMLSEKIAEAFHHVQTLQSQGAIGSFLSQIQHFNRRLYDINIKHGNFRAASLPLLSLIGGLCYVMVFYFGGNMVMENTLTIGELTAFTAYVGLMNIPIFGIGLFVASKQRAHAACERLEELDAVPLETQAPTLPSPIIPDTSITDQSQPVIALKDLHFSYPSHQVFSGLNLEILPGEHIGIVGKIGSGKSTLMKLLSGLYPCPAATYYLYGQDASTLPPSVLRQHIGWVTQEAQFFSQSIAFNLCLGKDDSTDEVRASMVTATKMAGIYHEIQAFPQGFNTLIGEDGVRLSGGQKQRLSLARMLMHQRQIYLFDDIFSALDHTTETQVISRLKILPATVLLISHRPSVIQFCDRVAVISEGHIQACGPYHTLKHLPLLQSLHAQDLDQSLTHDERVL